MQTVLEKISFWAHSFVVITHSLPFSCGTVSPFPSWLSTGGCPQSLNATKMPWYIVPFILQFSNGTSNPSYVLNLWLPFLPPARENSVFKWCMWLNHAHMDNLLIYLREAVPCNIIESWESNPSYLKSQGWYLACIQGEWVENLESHLRILPTAVPLLTLESIKKKEI